MVAGLLLSIEELTECVDSIFAGMFVGCEHHFSLLVIERDVVMAQKPWAGSACKNDVLCLRFIANDRDIRAYVAKAVCD